MLIVFNNQEIEEATVVEMRREIDVLRQALDSRQVGEYENKS